jgi:hypothetical protein
MDNVAMVAQLASLHDLHSLWEACVAFTSQFKVQPMVFASRAYCEMWVGNPAAAQAFTMQVAAKAAESYQQVAAEAGSIMGSRQQGGGALPMKRSRGQA